MDPTPPPIQNPNSKIENAEEPAQSSGHTRTGFVARLPKLIRDQINNLLLDGVPYAKIIETIGDPVKHLNEDHIRTWKNGGYQDWLADLKRNDALRSTHEAALDLVSQNAAATVEDATRAIAAAQLYELLLAFNPSALAQALASKPELYLRLISAIARLSEGEAICGHRRAQQSLIEAQLPARSGEGPKVIASETLKEIIHLLKLV